MGALCRSDGTGDPRRDALRQQRGADGAPDPNGLDYLELGNGEPGGDLTRLTVYFLRKLPAALRDGGAALKERTLKERIRIEGGRRIRDIRVVEVQTYVGDPAAGDDPEADDFIAVRVDKVGDHSTYTLRLVGLDWIDPRYDHLDFTFMIDCPSELDCVVPAAGPPAADEPEISYLAKDYATFRQLILDRLALLMPDWRERHAPDVGIALVETLAYVGDRLSYYQDAVATEAYLETARQRVSVRRHARLVDYQLSEGCNARAWVCVETDGDFALPARELRFSTAPPGAPLDRPLLFADPAELTQLRAGGRAEIFEPLGYAEPISFRAAHSEIRFYAWGGRECRLPKGATSATLLDTWAPRPAPQPEGEPAAGQGRGARGDARRQFAKQPPKPEPEPPADRWARGLDLKPGDVLILEEVLGPATGSAPDADPTRRHAVRLTRVTPAEDPVYLQTVEVDGYGVQRPTPVVEIEWAPADALPFELRISSQTTDENCAYADPVSVARGNVVLVDHGCWVGPEDLGAPPLLDQRLECECEGEPADIVLSPGRFRPRLERGPLTHREPLPGRADSAAAFFQRDPRLAAPQVAVTSEPADANAPRDWQPAYDLLGSGPDERRFVVETDNDGVAWLRFGDDISGDQPEVGERFAAAYRVGNGRRGNVGAEAIRMMILERNPGATVLRVRNPLPAAGGTEPESIAHAKLAAPTAFRKQLQRAVTADDYARLAERDARVQAAGAALVWTGSWYEAVVAIDPAGAEEASPALLAEIRGRLEDYRRIGHDLSVVPARRVPLDIRLEVCVLPTYLQSHVRAALMDLFGNRGLPGGKRGLFHPDNLTFGDGIYLSKLLAAAQAVPGVESAAITRLERQFEGPNDELANGILPLGPYEIAQADNDPSFPERGRVEFVLKGGN